MNALQQLKDRRHTGFKNVFLASQKSELQIEQSTILLAGDIGGTKTILRLVELSTDLSYKTIHQQKYVSSHFPDLVPIVRQFLQEGGTLPQIACFAIAGAVINNTSQLTNLNWFLDSNRLEVDLGIERVFLINDFAANCYGVLGLESKDLYTLQQGKPRVTAPIAVIGAGTGLGAGFLVPQEDRYQVFASEGGHADFTPKSELELQLGFYLQAKYQTDRVSVERLVSGRGIVDIYEFLRLKQVFPESSAIARAILDTKVDPAAIISQSALAKSDRLCEKTMEIFIANYGMQAGNLALTLLSFGGLYITGGIAAKILPLMQSEPFISAFKRKGRMSPILEEIPLHIVLNPQVGLLGSILCGITKL